MFDIDFGDQGQISCTGRLDAAQAEKAQTFLDAIPEPRIADFTDLEYLSSAGLGVLLKTQKRLMVTGGGLKLTNVSKHINDIFRYSGFDQIFEIEVAGE